MTPFAPEFVSTEKAIPAAIVAVHPLRKLQNRATHGFIPPFEVNKMKSDNSWLTSCETHPATTTQPLTIPQVEKAVAIAMPS